MCLYLLIYSVTVFVVVLVIQSKRVVYWRNEAFNLWQQRDLEETAACLRKFHEANRKEV